VTFRLTGGGTRPDSGDGARHSGTRWGDLLRTAIPVSVSVIILILLYSRIDPRQLVSSISLIDPGWTAVYVVLACLEPLVRAARWRALLGVGSFGPIAGGMYIGKACNNLFPLRMGDAVRVQYLRDRAGLPYRRTVASLIGETLMDLAFLALIGAVFALLAMREYGRILSIALVVLAAIALASTAVILHSRRKKPGTGIPGLLHALSTQMREMSSGHRGLRVLGSTLCLWIYTIVTAYCGLRIMLPSVSAIGVLGSIVLVYFAALIPSAPGFIGSYHAAVATSLGLMGYAFADYASLPIIVHALQFIPQVLIGLMIGMKYMHGNDWRRAYTDFNTARRRLMKGSE
jgi:glycosyltransferase 2 family protein